MNATELTDQELAALYHPWAIEFIKKHGREPAAIDSLRHHGDYMMAKGNEADVGDLQSLSRLFNLALEELAEDAPATIYIGNCSSLIVNMLSALRAAQHQKDRSAREE